MAPRKRARKGTAKAEPTTAAGEAAGAATHGPAATKAGPSKHSTSRRTLRGRRGGLKDMPNMPLDILIEIFRCMHPRDLLNLARTTKTFRAFLMSRDAAPFWKAARKQVEGLPDCPSFLSEPQYANLLFFSYCHNCQKSNIQNIIWEIYARYCQQCKEKLLENDPYGGWDMIVQVKKETGIEFSYTMVMLPQSSSYDLPHMHVPEVEALDKKWKACTSKEDKARFAQEQVDTVQRRDAPLAHLKAWKAAQVNERSTELEAIKTARFESVLERLKQEGWEDELGRMPEYTIHRLKTLKVVRKAQKLTDTVWRSIRQEVAEYMEGVQSARLLLERYQLLCDRLNILHDVLSDHEALRGRRSAMSEVQASFVDYALAPEIRAVVDAPSTTDVTREDLEGLLDIIPALGTEWFAARKNEFLAKVEGTLEVPSDVDPLTLATVRFKCDGCDREDLRWPNILAHKCARGSSYYGDQYKRALSNVCSSKGQRAPWRGSGALFTLNTPVDSARSVIAACGLDPDTATHEALEQCGARLVCMACSSDPFVTSKDAYDWRRAIAHKRPRRKGGIDFGCRGESKWKLLDPELTARVIERERAPSPPTSLVYQSMLHLSSPMQCCTRCRHRSRNGVVDHCTSQHDVADPQPEVDYYVHPDSQPLIKTVRIYPENALVSGIISSGGHLFASSIFE